AAVLAQMWQTGARRVLIEGGPTLLAAALRAGVVDEFHAYLAPVLLGAGLPAVVDLGVSTLAGGHRWRTNETHRLGDDVLILARRIEGDHRCSPDSSRKSGSCNAAPTS